MRHLNLFLILAAIFFLAFSPLFAHDYFSMGGSDCLCIDCLKKRIGWHDLNPWIHKIYGDPKTIHFHLGELVAPMKFQNAEFVQIQATACLINPNKDLKASEVEQIKNEMRKYIEEKVTLYKPDNIWSDSESGFLQRVIEKQFQKIFSQLSITYEKMDVQIPMIVFLTIQKEHKKK